MLKILNLIKDLVEVLKMKDNRRKWKLSPRLQIYIEIQALAISLKEKNIDDMPNHAILRELILEDCKIDYHCDGYGNPIVSEPEKP